MVVSNFWGSVNEYIIDSIGIMPLYGNILVIFTCKNTGNVLYSGFVIGVFYCLRMFSMQNNVKNVQIIFKILNGNT